MHSRNLRNKIMWSKDRKGGIGAAMITNGVADPKCNRCD